MRLKRLAAFALSIMAMSTLFTGCGGNDEGKKMVPLPMEIRLHLRLPPM